ncbi:tannase/feruloyl esterase family alpha/beta hydrolase [Bradyrhizobium sp. WSM2254]
MKLVAANWRQTRGRTRSLCEYPRWPKYSGKGSEDRAGRFTCEAN